MKKIMNTLILSCLKATELIEKKLHVKLSWTENMQLKAHKMLCRGCTHYEEQSYLLEKGIANSYKSEVSEDVLKALKQNITSKLDSLS